MSKRLILQHWAGEIPEIVRLSIANMQAYARLVGADYRLLAGLCFDPRLTAPCQKLAMLGPEFDAYDDVVMVDADQFARKRSPRDIFAETGYGWRHASAQARVFRHLGGLVDMSRPFWGGAVYRLPLDLRIALRKHFDYSWARHFNNRGEGEDEGIMHRLATLAQIPTQQAYFGMEWCWPSYDPLPERGHFIHIRHHPQPKMEQYHKLRQKGILE